MHSRNLLFLLLLLGIVACSPSQKTENYSFQAALPHQISNTASELSPMDLKKLAQAKGKTVEAINSEDLSKIIKSAKGRLFLFSFWTKDCMDCINQLQQLEAFVDSQEPDKYQLVFINLDDKTQLEEVNLIIRQKGIAARSFWLENKQDTTWQSVIANKWKPNHPFLLMVQNEEGVLMSYEKSLNSDELFSLLQPFSI